MRLLSFFYLLIFLHFTTKGQCDVAITGVDLNTYEVTIEVLNSLGCTANGPGGVNGEVTQLQIGYHLPEPIDPDNVVVDLMTLPDAPCSPQWDANGYNLGMNPNSFHPGWWYSPSTSVSFDEDIMGDGLVTGDIVIIPLNPPGDYENFPTPIAECGDDLIDYWLSEGECIEFVVWQLNYGATWYQNNGGWADGDGPGTYQDQDCDNSWYLCRDENPGAAVASPDFACTVDVTFPGCTDPTACNYDSNATENDGSCIYCDESLCDSAATWCYGCTDPTALNFDEDSQIDDGTCVYSTGPDLVPIDVEVVESYCNEALGGVTMFRINVTVTNIGTVDVVEWCASTFLTSNTWQCPNPDLAPGDTVTVEMNFSSEWISGQMNYLEIQFVEGPNGVQEIVTGNNILAGWSMPEFIDCTSPIAGCMDECANNYNPAATEDDGSCEYPMLTDTIYVELPPDTVSIVTYIYQIDSIFITDTVIDTLYIELPPDTLIEYVDNFIYDTLYIELPPDTLILTQIDTITIVETELIYDTLYIDNYIYEYDTLYITETEYITDTLIVTLTDTITEYIVQELWIDCNTGLPCDEDPPGLDCPDWTTIHIPNTFTPNNDGTNDVWKLVYDLDCWENVEFTIFNRWGAEIYYGRGDWFESYPFWDGSVNGGNHYVSDGVYVYLVKGKKVGRVEVVEATGHISVFR